MWLIILAVILIVTVAAVAYLAAVIGRFKLIRKASGDKRWLRILICLAVIFALLAVAAVTISVPDAILILIYSFVFFLLSGIIVFIFDRLGKKKSKVTLQGWIAIITTIIFLSCGYYLCNNVWQTDYVLKTEKDTGSLKVALIADSHLGVTFDGKGFVKELKRIEANSPDILMIAGDFVDDSSEKADLVTACKALGKAKFRYGVWFAYGNHDEGFFDSRDFSADELESIMKENGIHVLEDSCKLVADRFYVAGRKDSSLGPREDMEELLKKADPSKYIIVLDHEPNDYKEEASSKADLVLSGHTHGGQMFPFNNVSRLFGINDSVYGYERISGTDFIVTSGISDWALHFKTGTKSEYVIINISSGK